MTGQWDVFDELVGISAECFARCMSVVNPDFVGLGKIDCFARISAESRNRVDHFARAEIYNFNCSLVLSWNEQALALDVHRHVVEVALNIRQWDALDLFQWRAGLTVRSRNQDHAQTPRNCRMPFHSFAPRLKFSRICFARAEVCYYRYAGLSTSLKHWPKFADILHVLESQNLVDQGRASCAAQDRRDEVSCFCNDLLAGHRILGCPAYISHPLVQLRAFSQRHLD